MANLGTAPFLRWICVLALLPLTAGIASGSRTSTVETRYPGLEFGILGPARPAPLDENTLLASESFKITRTELAAAVKSGNPQLRGQLEKNLLFILDQLATRRVLLAEAKKTGIPDRGGDENRVVEELLERKSAEVSVSDDEVRAFRGANRELTGGAPFGQVKDNIRQYLLQDKKQRAVASYVSSLGNSAGLRVNESWLEREAKISLDNPVDKASASGKPMLVEFGATGCIPCDKMQPLLAARYGVRSVPVQAFFDGKGREVFRHAGFFPETEVVKQLSRMGVSK